MAIVTVGIDLAKNAFAVPGVTPCRMSGKRGENDAADAAAICEAVTRPNMRLVSQRGRAVELNAGLFIQPGRARAVTS